MVNINFSPFPILTIERLTLRQLSTDDQHDIFALRSDAEVNKYLGRAPSKSIDDALNFINTINDSVKNNTSIYWVISLTETQTFVGTICLYDFSIEENTCEIGYELMPEFQGQGIMKEAIESVIDYAFQALKFQKIAAFTHKENQHSTKLLTNFNFLKSETDTGIPNLNLFTLSNSN